MPARKSRPEPSGKGSTDRLLLDSLVENIPNMIFVKDAKDLRFVLFNRAGTKLLGHRREDLIGKNDYDFFPKTQADFFTGMDRKVLRDRKLLDIPEENIQTKNGPRVLHTKKIPLYDSKGGPRFLLGISEDITQRKQAERELKEGQRQLIEAQKLESVGRLAGGIAHEFNNILAGVTGLAKLIRDGDPNARGDAKDIIDQCTRAAALVTQLLDYSRRSPEQRMLIDVNVAAERLRKMLAVALRHSARLSFRLEKGLPAIEAARSQFEQVALNLCLDARDATTSRGRISVRTSRARVKARDYVRLSVKDDGRAISTEDQEHLFEPFFTTQGRGGGLRLPIAYAIVKQHGGFIDFQSNRADGTVFHVYWPAAPRAARAAPVPRGRERVLLAWSDASARRALAGRLKRLGYAVTGSDGGAKALRLLAAKPPPSLAVLDAGDGGLALYERSLPANRGLKAIFLCASGEAGLASDVVRIGLPHLFKPFTPDEAAWKIREVLDAR